MSFGRSRKREIVIDCVNRSTVVNQTDFLRYLSAQQRQLDEEFGEEWGTAKLACSQVEMTPDRAWQFIGLDDSDEANALGYHDDVKGPNGQPLGKAFFKTDLQGGYNWTITASHEIMEMLADPDINRTVNTDGRVFGGRGLICVAYEVCDACEADQFAKAFRVGGKVNGVDVMLSDFVTREWFEDAQGAAVDAYGHLTAPWQIGPGGYIGIYVPGRGWTQAFSNQIGDPTKLVMARRQLATMAEDNGIRHPELEDSPRRKARFAEEIAL
jgi:hypothetical protein